MKRSISALIVSILYYLALSFFYKNNEKIIILIQKILFYGYISSFLVLFFINPGIPGKGHFEKEFYRKYKGKLNELQRCDKCKILILKKSKSGHCVYCNICIMRYDHHCPWIGKCVGKNNFIIFYIFLISAVFFYLNGLLIFILYLKNNHIFIFK